MPASRSALGSCTGSSSRRRARRTSPSGWDRIPCLFGRADTFRKHRKHLPTELDIALDHLETLSLCASHKAQRTSRPCTPAQPKHQILITPALHTAGSFLGDFRTPETLHDSRTTAL